MLIAKGFVEKVHEDDGTLEAAIASTSVVDRAGDVINQDGWDLGAFKKNPQFLWGHNMAEYRPPIGKIEKIWFEGVGENKRMMFKPKFDLEDPFAKDLFRKVQGGFLNAFSVGFAPIEIEKREDDDSFGFTFEKAELLEISLVAVPANQEALVVLRDGGVKTVEWGEIEDGYNEVKRAVPFKATPTLPDSASWNLSEAKKRVKDWAKKKDGDLSFSKYRRAFAWYDSDNPEKLSSYKLLHHDVRSGELVVNWRATASAMASLLGARGGFEASDEERKAVYNHLKKHYTQYDKPIPEFRHVEEQTLKILEQEIKAVVEDDYKEYVKYTLRSIKGELRAERKARVRKLMKEKRRVVKK